METDFTFLPAVRRRLRRFAGSWRPEIVRAVAVLGLALFSLLFGNLPWSYRLHLVLLRSAFALRGERAAPQDVLLVAINQVSYTARNENSNYPLPRRYIADALEKIVAATPKVVIIDGTFHLGKATTPRRTPASPQLLAAGPTTIWSGLIPNDQSQSDKATIAPSDKRFSPRRENGVADGCLFARQGALAYHGWPAETGALLYEQAPIARALVELGGYKIDVPGQLDLINFYGPPGSIPCISLVALIKHDADFARKELGGKVVFVGYRNPRYAKGERTDDEYDVPVSDSTMFGVEVHATIAANLIDGSWIKRERAETETLWLTLTSFLMAAVAMRLKPIAATAFVVLVAVVALAAEYLAFLHECWFGGIGASW